MIEKRIIVMFMCCLSFVCCGNKSASDNLLPALSMTVTYIGTTSVKIKVKSVNATHMRVLCVATDNTSSQAAKGVVENGTKYTGTEIEIKDLSPQTTYTVFAVACDEKRKFGALEHVQFATEDSASEMYSWERERSELLSFTDMVLCYGGSHHRTPFLWEKQRFAPFVTYVDREGTEHWLFDSFLFIEFVSASRPDGKYYSYMVGVNGVSAEKAQWEEQINYWFNRNNGMNAIEQAVKEASQRLGTPPHKRKVVISMPDPIIYKAYADTNESTKYWGELNGQAMNFASSADRIAAYKWYINQVRKRFDEGDYQHVELAGFYIISEELASPDDGWNYELKRSDEIIPAVSEYLHSINQSLSWIPYNRSAGYTRWQRFGIDYAYMQPNHYWDDKGERPLSRFFADVKSNDLAMEFEFDEELLEGKPKADIYKARFREYMAGAKQHGIYGTKPLSYYHGTNGFYDLSLSAEVKDKELYHEFCQFVINNPLRE